MFFIKLQWKNLSKNLRYHNSRPRFNSWVRKIHQRRDRLPTPVFLGFTCGSIGKEFTCNAGDLCSIPRLGRFPGEGKGYPLQYPGLENPMDCIVRGVAKSRTWLTFTFTYQLHSCDSLVSQTVGKKLVCNAGDPASIPRLGRSFGEGNGNPFQYSCLENSMGRGTTVHGVAKRWTQWSD